MTIKPYLLAALALMLSPAQAKEVTELKTDKDRISYAVGANIARNFKREGIEFDPELVIRGLRDANAGTRLLLTEPELKNVMNTFQADVRRKMAANQREAGEKNKQKGDAFLAANKSKDGVIALPSGVQYKILKAGNGKTPAEADTVECHYRGMLLDGTQFDGTDPGKPATLKLSQLIKGWQEALKRMPVGSKWQLWIPSELAYGQRGVGQDIGPNETLSFEVELLAIKPPAAAGQ